MSSSSLSGWLAQHRGQSAVVGVSWTKVAKAPAARLLVTTRHEVLLYRSGESACARSWSLRASGGGSNALTAPTVQHPGSRRYCAVQGGSKLVMWGDSDANLSAPDAFCFDKKGGKSGGGGGGGGSNNASTTITALHVTPALDAVALVFEDGAVGLADSARPERGAVALVKSGASSSSSSSGGGGGGASGGGGGGATKWRVLWSALEPVSVLGSAEVAVLLTLEGEQQGGGKRGGGGGGGGGYRVRAFTFTPGDGSGAHASVRVAATHALPRPEGAAAAAAAAGGQGGQPPPPPVCTLHGAARQLSVVWPAAAETAAASGGGGSGGKRGSKANEGGGGGGGGGGMVWQSVQFPLTGTPQWWTAAPSLASKRTFATAAAAAGGGGIACALAAVGPTKLAVLCAATGALPGCSALSVWDTRFGVLVAADADTADPAACPWHLHRGSQGEDEDEDEEGAGAPALHSMISTGTSHMALVRGRSVYTTSASATPATLALVLGRDGASAPYLRPPHTASAPASAGEEKDGGGGGGGGGGGRKRQAAGCLLSAMGALDASALPLAAQGGEASGAVDEAAAAALLFGAASAEAAERAALRVLLDGGTPAPAFVAAFEAHVGAMAAQAGAGAGGVADEEAASAAASALAAAAAAARSSAEGGGGSKRRRRGSSVDSEAAAAAAAVAAGGLPPPKLLSQHFVTCVTQACLDRADAAAAAAAVAGGGSGGAKKKGGGAKKKDGGGGGVCGVGGPLHVLLAGGQVSARRLPGLLPRLLALVRASAAALPLLKACVRRVSDLPERSLVRVLQLALGGSGGSAASPLTEDQGEGVLNLLTRVPCTDAFLRAALSELAVREVVVLLHFLKSQLWHRSLQLEAERQQKQTQKQATTKVQPRVDGERAPELRQVLRWVFMLTDVHLAQLVLHSAQSPDIAALFKVRYSSPHPPPTHTHHTATCFGCRLTSAPRSPLRIPPPAGRARSGNKARRDLRRHSEPARQSVVHHRARPAAGAAGPRLLHRGLPMVIEMTERCHAACAAPYKRSIV
jgi:hypothetical protein